MTTGPTYTPAHYDAMFADAVRAPAYLRAIARVVRGDDVVVEIGTGVGYFAVAACRAGARHVYAIECAPSILLAAQLARENGFADRITFLRADANRVTLPERGTVLLFDLRGPLPFLGDAIPTIVRARERLITDDARLIPRRDTVHAAPCLAPRTWSEVEDALGDALAGVSRRTLAVHARSYLHCDQLAAGSLCAEPALLATLDYSTIRSPDLDARVGWSVARPGLLAGIGLWFDAELADSVGYSTAPGGPATVHGHGFLPFERALDAAPGDVLACRIRAKLVDGAYVFAWDTEFQPAAGRASVTMRQSSLGSLVASPAERGQWLSSYRPDPAATALVRQLLELADGHRTLAEIAEALMRAHPGRFADTAAALAWVTRRHAEIAGAEGS